MDPVNAGRSHDVACDEFMVRHSEYVDGFLSPIATARLSAHADACASCARYDRIVRKGIDLVRDLPDVEPSEEFELRLQHRIFHMQDDGTLARPRAAGMAAALGVAAMIALLAWSPLLVVQSDPEIASPALEPTQPMASTAPLSSPTSWYPMTIPAPAQQSSGLLAMFPGPYSPLIVMPPAHRSVRTVSTEYAPVD